MFTTIGYSDQESTGLRHVPDFKKESQRFQVKLRTSKYLNLTDSNSVFNGLDGNLLSKAMKSFSSTACKRRQNYITEKLSSNKSPGILCPIPITLEEEENQLSENSMTNKQLISVINSLIGSFNEVNRPQFKGLGSKKKEDLLLILQQVKDIHNGVDGIITEDAI